MTMPTNAFEVEAATKEQLLTWAKSLEIKGRHEMTKATLAQAVIEAYTQDEPEATQDKPKVAQDELEVAQDEHKVAQGKPKVNQDEPEVAQDNQDEPEATQDKPEQTEAPTLSLPAEIITEAMDLAKVTSERCSDPGRLVVNRLYLFEILGAHWNVEISQKIANQLVSIASQKLPRQPLTIQSNGSRFKYLLAETNEGQSFPVHLLILDYLWDKPELFNQAKTSYKIASETGSEFVS
jgi:hypothetical protein